jgi:cob(I)alamin adenosyltransferase
MPIYTRTGDRGETDLPDGSRAAKDAPRLEACGAVDELSAVLGLARAESLPPEIDRLLGDVQNALFTVGAELAVGDFTRLHLPPIGLQHVAGLEAAIDRCDKVNASLFEFILPVGTRAAATLHVARAVCRRAERRTVALLHAGQLPAATQLVAYLNRLSDLLFVLARAVNAQAGQSETAWRQPGSTLP